MKNPNTFELLAEADEDGSFRVKAGAGCLFLALSWLGVGVLGVAWAIAKLVLR